jgi:hypothetical protein
MRFPKVAFLFLFSIGFSFQNCKEGYRDDCGCGPFLGNYFDINGLEIISYKKRGTCCADPILVNETVSFINLSFIALNFKVDYLAAHNRSNSTSFFSTLNACTCVQSGRLGAKNEKISNLSIITLNDFDATHLANDNINDLFDYVTYNNKQDLNTFLATDTSFIKNTGLSISLKTAPQINKQLKFKAIIKLSNGEVYTAENKQFTITN